VDPGLYAHRVRLFLTNFTVTNIIGKAAKRLEELRRAGIEIPSVPLALQPASLPDATSAPAGAAVRSLRKVGAPFERRLEAKAPDEPVAASRKVELDFDALAAQGFLTPSQLDRALADDFRIIKMRLLKNVAQAAESGMSRSNVVLVASALPGEGKTYFSINLALSIAMTVDNSVMLVDADVLRPSVLSRLGIGASMGLTDLLMNPGLPLSDVLLSTNVPKLSVLPSGSMSEKASELIASSSMEELLSQLSARYPDRIIVVDGPPLLVTTVARALAPKVGQVVLVVEASRTTASALTESLAALESCPLVSAVLNKCGSHSHGAGYGYGYYGEK
jgi:protein-tyrosine kinase